MKSHLGPCRAIVMALAVLCLPALAWANGAKEQSPAFPGPADLTPSADNHPGTVTPIEHVVVLFDENVSFDHYFGTYPRAKNPASEPPFYAAPGTPAVDGLSSELLTDNPNGANPQRLDRSQAMTADMDHGYTAEQEAFDAGLMNRFVQATGHGNDIVMDYYDGNTVTALWNYAQHFAMSDDSFGTTFGPSSPGALNLVAGQTHGASAYSANSTEPNHLLVLGDPGYPSWALNANGTLFSDVDPYFDSASKKATIRMRGENIGDLLNKAGVTWGWFEGGFANPAQKHRNVGGAEVTDYIPHHEPFQFYGRTSNPNHLPPTAAAMIGKTDQANHQYSLSEFWQAADADNLPAVSFLKAAGYEDGHAGYSDPLDEQTFLVDTINRLEKLPTWSSTAIFISWDDSDGWYDHVMGPIVRYSDDPAQDRLTSHGSAGEPAHGTYLDRAGYGPRIPLLAISPWAKRNFVAHTVSDQSSIIRFIEDNWRLDRLGNQSSDAQAGGLTNMFRFENGYTDSPLYLDPATGEPVAQVAPETKDGELYMSLGDLAQSLDVQLHVAHGQAWFVYAGYLVTIPSQGRTVSIDEARVNLGAPIVGKDGDVTVPVDRLAAALGLVPERVAANEIVFRPTRG